MGVRGLRDSVLLAENPVSVGFDDVEGSGRSGPGFGRSVLSGTFLGLVDTGVSWLC